MPARVIDGQRIAAEHRERTREQAAGFSQLTGIVPHLAAVLVGDDPASAVYVRNKERACAAAGFRSTLHRLPGTLTQGELLELVARLNEDSSVHGILVQSPLPTGIDPQTIYDAILPAKDVDAFHPENVGLIAQGRPRFLPCTPAGVMELLRIEGVETAGRHAVVVGRSEIVGKPMALLLMQKGADATVTVAHSRTRNLPEVTRQAEILIAAVGRPRFLTAEFIRPGATVIDVGINATEGGLVGDVDFAAVAEIAGAITPVPRGVGPMTIALLLANTLTAARQTL